MSMPIQACTLIKAAKDEELFRRIHPMMHRNVKGGHFSIFPCSHDPPCAEVLTEEEQLDLMARLRQPPAADAGS